MKSSNIFGYYATTRETNLQKEDFVMRTQLHALLLAKKVADEEERLVKDQRDKKLRKKKQSAGHGSTGPSFRVQKEHSMYRE